MTIKTAQILLQIAQIQSRLDMLNDAANQIALLTNLQTQLAAQLTPDSEPDTASLTFAQSQIATVQTNLATAAAANPVAVSSPVLNTAAPVLAKT